MKTSIVALIISTAVFLLNACGGASGDATTGGSPSAPSTTSSTAPSSSIQVRDGVAYLPNESTPFTGVAVDENHVSQGGNPEVVKTHYEAGKLTRLYRYYPSGKLKVERWGAGLSQAGQPENRKMYWPNGQIYSDETITSGNGWSGSAYYDTNGKAVDKNAASWPPPGF